MNAVGIDVSKGKSTVTIRRPGDMVLMPPCDIPHTQSAIHALIKLIKSLDGETKACMEHTGRYYESVANWLSDSGIFVSTVNPILIRDFGDDSFELLQYILIQPVQLQSDLPVIPFPRISV